jgi:hypothetical protein
MFFFFYSIRAHAMTVENTREGDCQLHARKDINSPYYPLDNPGTVFMPCNIYAGNYPTWKGHEEHSSCQKKD